MNKYIESYVEYFIQRVHFYFLKEFLPIYWHGDLHLDVRIGKIIE